VWAASRSKPKAVEVDAHMSEQENRDTIKRYFQAVEQRDLDAMANLMHDDYTEEYPQSGEKIRGKHNARSILENYPGGLPNMIDHSYVVSGDLGVMKMTLEYGDKIKRARAYFGEPFEAPEWRAQWVERM
jgi:ketosteroid isomerase-like protein